MSLCVKKIEFDDSCVFLVIIQKRYDQKTLLDNFTKGNQTEQDMFETSIQYLVVRDKYLFLIYVHCEVTFYTH